MIKFFTFESVANQIVAMYPLLNGSLLVSIGAGLVAGVLASVISHPADVVTVTLSNNSNNQENASDKKIHEDNDERDDVSLWGTVQNIYSEKGLGGFFVGLSSRCLWAGCIISGQFFLYDAFRNVLEVNTPNLTLYMDVLGTLQQ